MQILMFILQMVCHQYWPDGSTATIFNYISVKLINEVQESGSIIRRTFGIKDMNVSIFINDCVDSNVHRVVTAQLLFNCN